MDSFYMAYNISFSFLVSDQLNFWSLLLCLVSLQGLESAGQITFFFLHWYSLIFQDKNIRAFCGFHFIRSHAGYPLFRCESP